MNQLASSHLGGPLPLHPLGQAKPTHLSPTEPAQAVPSTEVWSHLNLQQQAQVNQALVRLCRQIAATPRRTKPDVSESQEASDEAA